MTLEIFMEKINLIFLYILKGNKLKVINFTIKNVDKIIDFNQTNFGNIYNWNNNYNNYIIFFQFRKICDFDINNNKIITEYKKNNCKSFRSILFQIKMRILAYLCLIIKLIAILYKFN